MDPINVVVVGLLAVAVLLGSKKLPEMARSIGRAQGEFKKGLREGVSETDPHEAAKVPPDPDPES